MKNIIGDFLRTSPVSAYLEKCWNGSYHRNYPEGKPDESFDPGNIPHVLFFHVYKELAFPGIVAHDRIEKDALFLASLVDEEGILHEWNDKWTDHPAPTCTVADALGTVAFYSEKLGISKEKRKFIVDALFRILERNHRIRYPGGATGKTQQLRFELRVYYWAWILRGEEVHKERFFEAFENGLHLYMNPAAVDGGLIQPSINHDWTWNYDCSSGLNEGHATNTHTPAYYCTEPDGFMFVYIHAVKHGFMERRVDIDEFCRGYVMGYLRNMSRNGYLMSDLDGYGIHRAWYAPVLIESVPLNCLAMASMLGMDKKYIAYLAFYVRKYLDFFKSFPEYATSGLTDALPYGHKIGIEAQFIKLCGVRFYGTLARALVEYEDLIETEPLEIPAYGCFAWKSQWLRVSTPSYETSFVGATNLRNIPVVKRYGDPHLGTLVGGALFSTIFSGNALMHAASFPVESLWHIEAFSHNGSKTESCSTSFDDEFFMSVRTPDGRLLDQESFLKHSTVDLMEIKGDESIAVSWLRRERKHKLNFAAKLDYYADKIDATWTASSLEGYYIDKVVFCIPLPAGVSEYLSESGDWKSLEEASFDGYPKAVRWSRMGRTCEFSLELAKTGATVQTLAVNLPDERWMPGSGNAFCPFKVIQLRIELTPAVSDAFWSFRHILKFD